LSYAIETVDLRKSYTVSSGFRALLRPSAGKKTIEALRGVSIGVRSGEIYGLLGPNGAGKTTLIKILATLLHPDSGHARVFDMDVVKQGSLVKRRIGYVMGEERSFYWRLSGRENLRFFAALDDMAGARAHERISELLHLAGLEADGNRPFRGYSSGMRQKLAIARALLADPEVLLMDEPTRSLDPESAAVVRDLMVRLAREESRAVLFATHNLKEAEDISTRIGMMFEGAIRAEGSPEEIRVLAGSGTSYEIRFTEPREDVEGVLHAVPGLLKVTVDRDCVRIVPADPEFEISEALKALLDAGFKVESARPVKRELGDVFKELTREDA
jgi:ABC-2 type transport system ATP-binding protein